MSKAQSLAGLEILITRPEHQADEWREVLQAAGASVSHIPTLDIEAIDQPDLLALQNVDLGIFVSGNAVAALDALLAPDCEARKRPWYCVGRKTAARARSAGFKVCDVDAYDSQTLLATPALQQVQGRNIVIVRGEGGHTALGNTLGQRGANVGYCELYRRQCAWQNEAVLASYLQSLEQGRDGRGNIITASSVDSLNYTFLLAKSSDMAANVLNSTLLVPGDRVAAAAQAQGVSRLLQARSTRIADIVYVLNEWWADQQ